MSLDRPRGRAEITSEIRKREMDRKRRLDGSAKVVDDKKAEAAAARELKLGGTSEGIDAIKEAVEAARK